MREWDCLCTNCGKPMKSVGLMRTLECAKCRGIELDSVNNPEHYTSHSNKPRMSLIPPLAIEGAAIAIERGGQRQGREHFDWMGGRSWLSDLDGAYRHLNKFLSGIDMDSDEEGVTHLDAAIARLLYLSHQHKCGVGVDDRPKRIKSQG